MRVIGVLENALGPKQGLILGRLEGGPLEKTGVIAGMSGSPVFIDGKLVGAVAYSYPFAKETIAGITPISEMIEATRLETPRAASARFAPPRGAGGPQAPLDRQAVVAALERPLRAIFPAALQGPASASRRRGSRPWPCPWCSRASIPPPSSGRRACSPPTASRR